MGSAHTHHLILRRRALARRLEGWAAHSSCEVTLNSALGRPVLVLRKDRVRQGDGLLLGPDQGQRWHVLPVETNEGIAVLWIIGQGPLTDLYGLDFIAHNRVSPF